MATVALLFNKPYGVLCQFSGGGTRSTLKDFVPVPDVYPAGRLDADSEGLVVLTNNGALQHLISHPRGKLTKTYWAQVEGIPDEATLDRLRVGVDLGDFISRAALLRSIPEPRDLWDRDPPIRFRRSIPTSWLEIGIQEGKNRQIRRMTAAIGCPTLRLIRFAIGSWTVAGLKPGSYVRLTAQDVGAATGTTVL